MFVRVIDFYKKMFSDLIGVGMQPQVTILWGFQDPSSRYMLVIGESALASTRELLV